MRNRPTITLGVCVAGALIAGLALARPGGSDPAPASGYGGEGAAAAAAPSPAIEIAGFDFGRSVTVAPGAAIQIDNLDGVPHTVTADDGAFDSGTIGGGGTGILTAPGEVGSYSFFCTIHPSMRGSLVVDA